MNLNTDETVKSLNALKLYGMAHYYQGVLSLAAQDQPSGHELAALMADAEKLFREDKRAKTLFTLAKLRLQCHVAKHSHVHGKKLNQGKPFHAR